MVLLSRQVTFTAVWSDMYKMFPLHTNCVLNASYKLQIKNTHTHTHTHTHTRL